MSGEPKEELVILKLKAEVEDFLDALGEAEILILSERKYCPI